MQASHWVGSADWGIQMAFLACRIQSVYVRVLWDRQAGREAKRQMLSKSAQGWGNGLAKAWNDEILQPW